MYTTTGKHCEFKLSENFALRSAAAVLAFPFDIAREGYTKAVKTGLIPDSLIECARYSRDLSASEKMALGPWARSW